MLTSSSFRLRKRNKKSSEMKEQKKIDNHLVCVSDVQIFLTCFVRRRLRRWWWRYAQTLKWKYRHRRTHKWAYIYVPRAYMLLLALRPTEKYFSNIDLCVQTKVCVQQSAHRSLFACKHTHTHAALWNEEYSIIKLSVVYLSNKKKGEKIYVKARFWRIFMTIEHFGVRPSTCTQHIRFWLTDSPTQITYHHPPPSSHPMLPSCPQSFDMACENFIQWYLG